jgi:hypothetical protein
VFRLLTLASIAAIGLGLAFSPAVAEEPPQEASSTKIEKSDRAIVPLPSLTHPKRLSTRDRWRGAPYLRSSSADETLRSHALDIALPPANPSFQGGVSLQSPTIFSNEDFIRNQALDKALPAFNPAFVGGGSVQGGVGF